MTRRSFFAALAALPFVPGILEQVGEPQRPILFNHSKKMILGYWVFDNPEDEARYEEWMKGPEFQEILKHAR